MKRNHLKKAILLGLIAASIHAPVWAEDSTTPTVQQETVGALWGDSWNGEKIVGSANNPMDLIINANDNVGIGYNGTVNVVNGNLTVNTNNNGIYVGYIKEAKIDILANNVKIESKQNGIYMSIENGGYGTLNIGESDETGRKINNLTITSHGQGIDNKNGTVNIYGSADSNITISSE